jgi:hypothetical protein
MHTLGILAIFLGMVTLLAIGILSAWRDLLHMTHDAPLFIEDDGLAWSSRYRGIATAEPGVSQAGQIASRS